MDLSKAFESQKNLREEINEKDRLERENFDLKLQLHHLEDSLKRFLHSDSVPSELEELANENTSLKLQVHQQSLQLDERNIVLAKARDAITNMKTEMERLRKVEEKSLTNSPDKLLVSKLEQERAMVQQDYEDRLTQKKYEIAQLKADIQAQEARLIISQKHSDDLEDNLRKSSADLITAHREREEALSQLESMDNARNRAENAEEELTQLRAQVELYAMQAMENSQHGGSPSRQALEDARVAHSEAIADVRRNYHNELETATRNARERAEASYREEMDLLRRTSSEKTEEAKSARKMLERHEAVVRESEALKVEMREKDMKISTLQSELASKIHDFELLQRSDEDFKSNLHATSGKLEQSQLSLQSTTDELRRNELTLRQLQGENIALQKERDDLKPRADRVEAETRENERLKAQVAEQESALKDERYAMEKLKRDFEEKLSQVNDLSKQVQQKTLTEENLNRERARADSAEAVLADIRSAQKRSDAALEAMRTEHTKAERQLAIVDEANATLQNVNKQLVVWERMLDGVLDTLPLSKSSSSSSISSSSSSSKERQALSATIALESIVERLHVKTDRVSCLRDLLVNKCATLTKEFEVKLAESQKSVERAELRLTRADTSLNTSQKLIERDRKQRTTQVEDLRLFRERILEEHSIQLKESSNKIAELTAQLEQERINHGVTKKQETKVVHLTQQNEQLQDQLAEFAKTEEMIQNLQERLDQLMGTNEALNAELAEARTAYEEIQTHTVVHLRQEIETTENELHSMRDRLQQAMHDAADETKDLNRENESLRDIIRNRDEQLMTCEEKIAHLEQRQMDPELVRRIKESQHIVEDNLNVTLNSHVAPHNDHQVVTSATSAGGKTVQPSPELVSLVDQLKNHINASDGVKVEACSLLKRLHDVSSLSEEMAHELKREVKTLLDTLMDIGNQIHTMSQDWLRGLRRLSPILSEGDDDRRYNSSHSPSPGHSRHYSHRLPPPPSHHTHLPTRTTSTHHTPLSAHASIASPLATPASITGSTPGAASRHRGLHQYLHRQRQQEQQQQHYHRQHAMQKQHLHASQSRLKSTDLEVGHVNTTILPTPSAHAAATTASMSTSPNHQSLNSGSPVSSPKNVTAGSLRGTAMTSSTLPFQTPLTAARASVSRLNRLSTDLHHLAEKLDRFESKSMDVK